MNQSQAMWPEVHHRIMVPDYRQERTDNGVHSQWSVWICHLQAQGDRYVSDGNAFTKQGKEKRSASHCSILEKNMYGWVYKLIPDKIPNFACQALFTYFTYTRMKLIWSSKNSSTLCSIHIDENNFPVRTHSRYTHVPGQSGGLLQWSEGIAGQMKGSVTYLDFCMVLDMIPLLKLPSEF